MKEKYVKNVIQNSLSNKLMKHVQNVQMKLNYVQNVVLLIQMNVSIVQEMKLKNTFMIKNVLLVKIQKINVNHVLKINKLVHNVMKDSKFKTENVLKNKLVQ